MNSLRTVLLQADREASGQSSHGAAPPSKNARAALTTATTTATTTTAKASSSGFLAQKWSGRRQLQAAQTTHNARSSQPLPMPNVGGDAEKQDGTFIVQKGIS
jgi:hypothetical protein